MAENDEAKRQNVANYLAMTNSKEQELEGLRRELKEAEELTEKLQSTRLELTIAKEDMKGKISIERENRQSVYDYMARLKAPRDTLSGLIRRADEKLDVFSSDFELYYEHFNELVEKSRQGADKVTAFQNEIKAVALNLENRQKYFKDINERRMNRINTEVSEMRGVRNRLRAKLEEKISKNKETAEEVKACRRTNESLRKQTQQKADFVSNLEKEQERMKVQDLAMTEQRAAQTKKEQSKELKIGQSHLEELKKTAERINERKKALEIEMAGEEAILQQLEEVKQRLSNALMENNVHRQRKLERDERIDELTAKILKRKEVIEKVKSEYEALAKTLKEGKIEEVAKELLEVENSSKALEEAIKQYEAKKNAAKEKAQLIEEECNRKVAEKAALLEKVEDLKQSMQKKESDSGAKLAEICSLIENKKSDLQNFQKIVGNLEVRIRDANAEIDQLQLSVTDNETVAADKNQMIQEIDQNLLRTKNALTAELTDLQNQNKTADDDLEDLSNKITNAHLLAAEKNKLMNELEELGNMNEQLTNNVHLYRENIMSLETNYKNLEKNAQDARRAAQEALNEKDIVVKDYQKYQEYQTYLTFLTQENEKQSSKTAEEEKIIQGEIEKIMAQIKQTKEEMEAIENKLAAEQMDVPVGQEGTIKQQNVDNDQRLDKWSQELSSQKLTGDKNHSQERVVSNPKRPKFPAIKATKLSQEKYKASGQKVTDPYMSFESEEAMSSQNQAKGQFSGSQSVDDLAHRSQRLTLDEYLSGGRSVKTPPRSPRTKKLPTSHQVTASAPKKTSNLPDPYMVLDSDESLTSQNPGASEMYEDVAVTIKTEKLSQEEGKKFFKSPRATVQTPFSALFGASLKPSASKGASNKRLPFRSTQKKPKKPKRDVYNFESDDGIEFIGEFTQPKNIGKKD